MLAWLAEGTAVGSDTIPVALISGAALVVVGLIGIVPTLLGRVTRKARRVDAELQLNRTQIDAFERLLKENQRDADRNRNRAEIAEKRVAVLEQDFDREHAAHGRTARALEVMTELYEQAKKTNRETP